MQPAEIVLALSTVYVAIGVVFGVSFVAKGLDRLDPAAHGVSIGVRLLLLPGSVALWPILLWKWVYPRSRP